MKTTFVIFLIGILMALAQPASSFAMTEKASDSSAALVKDYETTQLDTRAIILRHFLESYKSPLADSSETFVRTADEYNLDWRIVASISGVESTFAHQLPYSSYNAWGWGIYGSNMIYFTSYDEAIGTISKALREKYMDTWGAQNVYQIGRYYAASPTWAQRVDYFMNKVTQFERENPEKSLSISI